MAVITFLCGVLALATALPLTNAHFTFVRIALNNEWKEPTRYIRNRTSPYTEPSTPNAEAWQNERLYNFPTYATDRPDSVRCGRDNMAHAAATETLKVKAGDTVEMAHLRDSPEVWGDDLFYGCPDGRGTCNLREGYQNDINHPGPFVVHLSRAPDGTDVSSYDGSGEWIKIHTLGLVLTTSSAPVHWLPRNDGGEVPRFVYKIPKQTPAGQYLMRVDIIYAAYRSGSYRDKDFAQMYPSCVQIEVESESKTTLPKGVSIPAIFKWDQPGMTISEQMLSEKYVDKDYTYPGGRLWTGENMIEDKPAVK